MKLSSLLSVFALGLAVSAQAQFVSLEFQGGFEYDEDAGLSTGLDEVDDLANDGWHGIAFIDYIFSLDLPPDATPLDWQLSIEAGLEAFVDGDEYFFSVSELIFLSDFIAPFSVNDLGLGLQFAIMSIISELEPDFIVDGAELGLTDPGDLLIYFDSDPEITSGPTSLTVEGYILVLLGTPLDDIESAFGEFGGELYLSPVGAVIPEPATLSAIGLLSLGALIVLRRRRR